MGQQVGKNILKQDQKDDKKNKKNNRKASEDEEDDFEIRIDLVFPEFDIREDNIDQLFQGDSTLDKLSSEFQYSKITKSIWIQDINDEIQINRKFGKKVQIPFWVKKYKKTEENKKLFLNELLILSNLSHPFIITEKDYFQDDEYYYLVFEDYPGQPILQYYNKHKSKIGFTQIKLMIRDLLNVIKYIHMKKIAIRNLSPSNIYYDGDNIMLCNFERAEFYEDVKEMQDGTKKKQQQIKPIKFKQQFQLKFLQAPEVKSKKYSYQADVWVVGLVYLVFFHNRPKTLNSSIFKIRQQVIDEFCPGFTLEINTNKPKSLRRKSTMKFKQKLLKKLKKKNKIKDEEEYLQQQQEEEEQARKEEEDNRIIIDLEKRFPFSDLLVNLLKPNPKNRLNLDLIEEQSIFSDRIKQEDEQSFMDASLSIYNFLKRNVYLTPLKQFYVSNLMIYKIKSKFTKIQACFDLDGSGYLDQGEFIKGIKRSSPETSTKEAKKIYKKIDIDGNGFIEFEEFCVAFIADDFITSQQILKQIFEYFVDNEQRTVDTKKFFKTLEMTTKEYKKVRELVGQDDQLDLMEFLSLFRKIKAQLQTRQSKNRRASKFVKVVEQKE